MTGNNIAMSSDNETVAEPDGMIIGNLYLVTSVLVMIGNGIVMIVVVMSRELHLPTMWNIAFMALCDFGYGLHYLIFAVPSAFLKKFAYPESSIALSSSSLTLLFGQNVLNIVVATVDRYLCVCWPLRYTQLMTAKRFLIAILITVVINICRLSLIILPEVDVYYNPDIVLTLSKFNTLLSVLASVGLPAVSVIVIVAFLIKIIIALPRTQVQSYPKCRLSNRPFTITICLSAGVFCLSYLPTCIGIIWNLVYGTENVPIPFVKFGLICLLSNSLWNVVIYAATYKPFRDATLRLFCKGYFRRRAQSKIHIIYRNEALQNENRKN